MIASTRPGQKPSTTTSTVITASGTPIRADTGRPSATAADGSCRYIRFTSGAVGTIAVIGDAPAWWEDISIIGTVGAFHIRQNAGLTQQLGWREPQMTVNADALGGGSVSQDFIRAIQGKQEPVAPAECGLRVIELTEAAWKSAAQGGKPVKVPRSRL